MTLHKVIYCGMLPPSPAHILRGHGAQLNALSFSTDNERLYSGDASGHVIVTSARSLRPLASWRAHTDGILGVEEWNEDSIITHGRDNKLHVWTRVLEPTPLAETAATPTLPLPSLKFSMDVNALNYCRFSMLPASGNNIRDSDTLLALPNLIESSLADIWAVPSAERLHAAIGKDAQTLTPGDGRGESKTGIIMSLHLFRVSHVSASSQTQLRLLLAYEDGSVSLLVRSGTAERSVEGRGWDRLWTNRAHVESVMAMSVKRDGTAAFTISADHLLCRYDLEDKEPGEPRTIIHRTKHPGNGAIAVRDDGRVLAVGGWDGKVRLYSTKTFKALGTLSYHKEGCYAIAFAFHARNNELTEEEGEEADGDGMEARAKWLATGGKDHRVSIWQLMDFTRQ